MREKSPRRADAFTAEAVTLNFSKCLNTFAHLLIFIGAVGLLCGKHVNLLDFRRGG